MNEKEQPVKSPDKRPVRQQSRNVKELKESLGSDLANTELGTKSGKKGS